MSDADGVQEVGGPGGRHDSPAVRRAAVRGAVRAVASSAAVLLAYFILPLDRLESVPPAISLPVAVALFAVIVALQLRSISASSRPVIRAVEALAVSVPFLVVSFAGVYHVMSLADPASFSEDLSRLDSLYFTTTVLTTVGFGDIHAASPGARAAVTLQMVVNVLAIGLGVRLVVRAVRAGGAAR